MTGNHAIWIELCQKVVDTAAAHNEALQAVAKHVLTLEGQVKVRTTPKPVQRPVRKQPKKFRKGIGAAIISFLQLHPGEHNIEDIVSGSGVDSKYHANISLCSSARKGLIRRVRSGMYAALEPAPVEVPVVTA